MRKLIFYLLFFFLASSCFASDRITSYTNEKGETVYTNEKKAATQKNNALPSGSKISPGNQAAPGNESQESSSNKNEMPDNRMHNQHQQPFSADRTVDKVLFGIAKFASITVLFVLFSLGMWLFALIDILRHEFTGSNKLIWIIVVTIFPLIGSVLYFFIGVGQKYR